LASVRMQIMLWLRNANNHRPSSSVALRSSQGYCKHRAGPQFAHTPTFFADDLLSKPPSSSSLPLSSSLSPCCYVERPTVQSSPIDSLWTHRNRLHRVHCRSSPSAQCHFLFSIRFNSIQIQI
jgi:hypothetical protein